MNLVVYCPKDLTEQALLKVTLTLSHQKANETLQKRPK
jgi:hypothetical protein